MYSEITQRIGAPLFTLADLKGHMQVEHADDDTLIQLYLDAAIEYVEDVTRRVMNLANVSYQMDSFDDNYLDLAPIRIITTITYTDSQNATQTLAGYTLRGCELMHDDFPSATKIVIDAVSGYGDVAGVVVDPPKTLQLAVYMLAAHFYENREDTITGVNSTQIPKGVDSLIFKYRNYKA
ncbi:head-tail connector protein [uncultured Paraglaciecola sp.]|uniref:head-tail connector protein n=1 Tax=uncultured Paraglaciecola sp. TaxID=1765024 RepID=UPI002629A00E|nr:head-tail connector protein [uncultured Paraglaciecola sp.]